MLRYVCVTLHDTCRTLNEATLVQHAQDIEELVRSCGLRQETVCVLRLKDARHPPAVA